MADRIGKISREQARIFAYAIYRDIAAYVGAHQEEYQEFLKTVQNTFFLLVSSTLYLFSQFVALPQFIQNFAPSGSLVPQFIQNIFFTTFVSFHNFLHVTVYEEKEVYNKLTVNFLL